MKSIIVVLLCVTSIIHAAPTDDFVITVKTDNPGAGTVRQFTIYKQPVTAGASYNYNVDCDNDGIDEATARTDDFTCNYPVPGVYTIRIKDNTGTGDGFPGFYSNLGISSVAKKILTVEQWGTLRWRVMNRAFFLAENLNITATDTPDFSNVRDMNYMFYRATSANPDTSNWDTSSVVSMSYMFYVAILANPDTSNWDTSSVKSMWRMFKAATSANPDTSN